MAEATAAQVEIEDQASVTNLDNGEIFDALSDDAESSVQSVSTDSLVLLREGNVEHDFIRTCFLSGMGTVANDTTIVAMRKNSWKGGITTRAKYLAFRIFTEAMKSKNGGDPNVRYGWYVGSKAEIEGIVSYGFSNRELCKFESDASSHGIGIHLVHSNFSFFAAAATEPDEEGVRHLLLCRLIIGKPEPIISGSKQSHPSSTEFDSGVDNLQNPRKYIIWSSTMNSNIFPSYIVSFKSPRLRVLRCGLTERGRSQWLSFAVLLSMLSKSIDSSRMNLILRTYHEFRKGKIQRGQLVQKMREVAGDNLLAEVIKNLRRPKQG